MEAQETNNALRDVTSARNFSLCGTATAELTLGARN